MPRTRTSLTVGIFVLIGLGLAVGAVVWLGLLLHLEEGHYYCAYFDESVQGLSKDSPVKYRGVSVGRVRSVDVAPDGTLIQVTLKIETGLKPHEDMIAQLKSVGITGIMYIELDRRDPEAPDLSPRLTFPSNFPVIATRPSEIARFMGEINALLEHIRSLDLKAISVSLTETLADIRLAVAEIDAQGVSTDMRRALQRLTQVLDPVEWKRLIVTFENTALAFKTFSNSADQAVTRLDRSVDRFDKLLAKNEPELSGAIRDFQLSMSAALRLIENSDRMISRADITLADLKRQLMVALQHMEAAGDNLREATEVLAEQPSRLIFGSPPPPRKIEGKSLP
jgi:phospholipid/cholesterol/gamma-HCH transport system substrate-binding protein